MPDATIGDWTVQKLRQYLTSQRAAKTSLPKDVVYQADLPAVVPPTPDTDIPEGLLTTTGDIIYAPSAGVAGRLGIGSSTQVLTVSSGLPSWQPAPSFTGGTYTAANSFPLTASVTNPSLGSGGSATISTTYTQIGKFVHWYGVVVFGSTMSPGSGTYNITLPITAAGRASGISYVGSVWMHDNSSGDVVLATANLVSTTKAQFDYPTTYGAGDSSVSDSAPWTWGSSDFIRWQIMYEAA